jgi:putative addiction module component (TIGR02574 family)
MTTLCKNIETLPLPERILMVEDIWDSIAKNNANIPVLEWQKKELSRRKQSFRKNPDSVMTWQQVKKSILVRNA